MTDSSGLGEGGRRQQWSELPPRIRALVSDAAGAPVVDATTCAGGFSPGVAATLRLADRSRVFIKASSSELNPDTPQMHRREIEVNGWLPEEAPVPRLRWHHDDGEWVVLLFDHLGGANPALPWRSEQLGVVLRAIAAAHAVLSPAPDAAPSVSDVLAADFSQWRRAADSAPAGLDAWSLRHVGTLAAHEARWAEAVTADTLAHLDLRADNLLVDGDRAWLVDWPAAARCAGWADVVGMAPSVVLQGGPSGPELLDRYPGERPDDDQLAAFLAALTGYFVVGALRPPPPGIPTVRAYQAAQGRAAQSWLAELLRLR